MNKPCNLATCRHCRPGRPCAESARWEAEEDRTEEVDRVHDAFRAQSFRDTPNRPEGEYVDRAEPYPHTSSGILRDDPAMDWR